MLGYAELAELAGVTESTVRAYAVRGLLVEPDAHDGRRPRWHLETARRWLRNRPGRGNYPRRRKRR